MPWKEIVGARFSPAEFDDYVAQLDFSAWRPQFVVIHNTGIPALADKPAGYTQAQMQNLVHYYRDTQGWSAGPHCFIDQNGIWVFTPLTTSGVHSPSWNGVSWGIETLGDYSTEAFTDPIHEHLVACLATLHSVVPLDVSNLHFHKEDPLTTHNCPGNNISKAALIHDVRQLILSRHTLADPASGRYTGDSPADVAPQSHFFVDHTALDVQTDDLTFGPVNSTTPADKENKFRVTSLFKATADVKAYAVVSGTIMLQRVTDAANPGSYRTDVVNLVIQPYHQPMAGFTPVKYFIYRNLRLDSFLKGGSPADEKLVRAETNGSTFIQNQWAVHTAWNGAVPFESVKLGYDPANQPGTAKIDGLFYRQNPNEQLPFVARGDHIGDFYTNLGQDAFGIEILLEGDFQPDYNYVRTYKEVIIDASATGVLTLFSVRLEREKVLNFIDPAAFFSLHVSGKGWLQVTDGAGKKKLPVTDVYDQVISKFATRNTLYVDIRNENGRSLNFYGAYDDGSGNALGLGGTGVSFGVQPYGTDKWPLIIRKLTGAAGAGDHNTFSVNLLQAYNHKPALYLEQGETAGRTTKGRFIAGADLIAPGATTTESIGFRYPNKDLGGGSRIGVAWLLKFNYTMRQDAANSPFPPTVVPTESYLDNLFGPIDIEPQWAVSSPVIAWVTVPEKKYVDGTGAGMGFEHIAERGVGFSNWTGSSSIVGNVLFFAVAKDVFINSNKDFVPHASLVSGVSNRDSFFEEPMLFDGYSAEFKVIKDGLDEVPTLNLNPAQPRPRPPETMLLVGLTRNELETQLKPLAGFDKRYPRNLLLQEVTGGPFTDPNGTSYRKYKVGVRGMNDQGAPYEAFPAVDVITYTLDRKSFCSKAFTASQPPPEVLERDAEEKRGETMRAGETYPIAAASGATLTVTPPSVGPLTPSTADPPIDFTREIVPGDMVTVKDEIYNVISVSTTTGGAVITLDATPVGVTPKTDTLRAPNKKIEDYYIAKDRLGTLSGINRMEVLVADFGASLSVVPNDTTAPAMIAALVNDYGPKILQRARLICANADFAYADDRILYWARIKMMVAMKNHPYWRKDETKRKDLVKLFERKSRGFDAVSFAGAGGRKKVLIAGFDPFLLTNIQTTNAINHGNPSGAAALALHGRDFPATAPTIHVQSAIFPTRHADFDAGIVETFFEKFINDKHVDYNDDEVPDIIVTLSQGVTFDFELDRFACQTRRMLGDNLDPNNPSPFPGAVDDEQFYETTLPITKLVPLDNKGKNFEVFYNNFFWYTWNAGKDKASYPSNFDKDQVFYQPDSGTAKIESPDPANPGQWLHPQHGLLSGTVPSQLGDSTTPTKSQITARKGSGDAYLSNEIFYRVSRLRNKFKDSMMTGHLHVPLIQRVPGIPKLYSKVDSTLWSKDEMDPKVLRKLIEEVVDFLVKAFN